MENKAGKKGNNDGGQSTDRQETSEKDMGGVLQKTIESSVNVDLILQQSGSKMKSRYKHGASKANSP